MIRIRNIQEKIITLPSFLWLFFLFLVPTILVIYVSFCPSDTYGNIKYGFTLKAYSEIINPAFPAIIFRTLKISVYTTAICLAAGIPVAYAMAKMERKWQQNLMMLIIIPFWTNFLIRIYAWKIILHPEGFLKQFLVTLRIIPESASLLYNEGAVLLVLVYTYLPFAILPLYSAAEKFDFHLLEAARDIGSSPMRAFFQIFLPGISQGMISAIMVVFIPALGSYIIPDMVGGPNSEMLGNKIAQRVFIDRNLPRGSALSTILILAFILPPLLHLIIRKTKKSIRITLPGVLPK
ncbi:MAG: ABC transporter permease [Spirochaetia bacterium]|jgi:spermidine/putrescine transport system permease protein|nr:ABC transporter permease [Spirochaetia bacterium]